MEKSIKKNGMLLVMVVLVSITFAFAVDPKNAPSTSTVAKVLSKKRTVAPFVENPLIELKFDFNESSVAVNTGTAVGSFIYSYPIPAVTTNAVTGGTAFDFGTTPGNYYVESSDRIFELANLSAFTITGWLNCRSNTVGSGGNRVISWIKDGGHGVDLVYKSDGSLQLGINAWPNGSPAVSSPGKVPTNAAAATSNWVFFAITYESSNGQVQFYFGNTSSNASLDVTRIYNRGAVGSLIGDLAVGHLNDATRLKSGFLNRMFRGLIDDVKVYGSALTPSDIVDIQQASLIVDTEPPTPPVLTVLSKTFSSVTLGWSGATDNVGVTNYTIYSGDEAIRGTSETSITINQLSPNTAYSFSVKASDGSFNISDFSNVVNVTTDGAENSNTNTGYRSLFSNSDGVKNTAIGGYALENNSSGTDNTALGFNALVLNTTGQTNVSIGGQSLSRNTTGSFNTATGYDALLSNTTATGNTAFGSSALSQNTTGVFNTAVGVGALGATRTGNYNTAIGLSAGGVLGAPNTVGVPEVSNTTALGAFAMVTASNQVRLGNSDVTSIGGQVSWSTLSDGRFKKDLKNDVSGLEFIDQLNPVSYTVDKDAVDRFLGIPENVRQLSAASRKKSVRQSGFVAQEVEALVKKSGYAFYGVESPQNDKDHYSIRYAEFVVPLVKAVQELHAVVKSQRDEIGELKQLLQKNDLTKGENTSAVELHQNNPNPFTRDTQIKMSLPESAGQASVIVYNLEGRELKNYTVRERGNASIKIAGSELHPGMYLYTLIVDGKVVDTKRMILTK